MFKSEPSGPPARLLRPRLDAIETLFLIVLAFGAMFLLGGVLFARLGIAGLALAEIGLVLAPTVALGAARGVDLSAALALRRPSWRTLIGAVLAGAGGFWLTAAVLEWAIEQVAPLPPAVRDAMREVIVPRTGARPLVVDLAVLALLPAVCEEALFRGALVSSLRPAGRAACVAGTALLFGFYHGSAWKVLPTGALGLVLAIAVLRAGSLAAPVVIHLVNNTLVVLLVRAGIEDPPPPTSPTGAALAAAAVAALALGIQMTRPDASPKGGISPTSAR